MADCAIRHFPLDLSTAQVSLSPEAATADCQIRRFPVDLRSWGNSRAYVLASEQDRRAPAGAETSGSVELSSGEHSHNDSVWGDHDPPRRIAREGQA